MSIHHLKIQRQPFEDLVSGRKTGEVRNCADREFREGDHVELFLIDETGNPANKSIVRTITHIQRGYGLPDDVCVLSYAAPVVERQPRAWECLALKGVNGEHGRYSRVATSPREMLDFVTHYDGIGAAVTVIELFTAPPELAELQATIARLTTENESVKLNLDKTDKRYLAAVAEIERLKGGQGEPVAYVLHKNGEVDWDQEVVISNTGGDEPDERFEWRPVYTSQPAPVSVDLSALREYHAKAISNLKSYADDDGLRDSDIKHYTKRAAFHEEMVALIDKVKDLNQ
jgi:hypothetical protein